MKTIINIEKLTNTKYLNLYKITYLNSDGSTFDYYLSSRRDLENLELKKEKTDAVRAVPYIKKDGKTYYENFERKEHDKLHGYHYYYQEEKGLSDLNNPSSSYVASSTVYYDGYYSYSLGSDDRYTKVEDETL